MIAPANSFTMGFISCQGENQNPELEPELRVETLISNFAANGAVSVDINGHIYISEYGRFVDTGGTGTRVFKLNAKGEILETIEGLSGPMGTAKDSKGNLFINNANNTAKGEVLKIAPSPGPSPQNLTVSAPLRETIFLTASRKSIQQKLVHPVLVSLWYILGWTD